MNYYVYSYLEEKEHGPLPAEEVIEMLYGGTFQWTDVIRDEDDDTWSKMSEVFDLEEIT